MRSSLKIPYLLLLILLISCFSIYFSISSPSSWIKAFSIEMASEIIGIFLVVFSIDRVIENEQAKERKKLELVAFCSSDALSYVIFTCFLKQFAK